MMKLVYLLLLLSVWSNVSFGQIDGIAYDWQEKKNKDGIKVFTSKVPGSKYNAVRAEMLVAGKISSLVALVSDNDACPEWADLCKESKAIEEISDSEKYIYIYNDIPFPVKDRDVMAFVIWKQDPKSGKVTMVSTATKDRYPKNKKAVRIENAISMWHFTPTEEGEVLVENFAHIDPNGPTPAWVTNMLLVSSPFKTMRNMREVIESGEYSQAVVPFLAP